MYFKSKYVLLVYTLRSFTLRLQYILSLKHAITNMSRLLAIIFLALADAFMSTIEYINTITFSNRC